MRGASQQFATVGLAARVKEPRLRPAKSSKSCAAVFGTRDDLACLVQEILAGLGQQDAAADAVKHLGPIARFERRDRGAGC
jgi:hypothetical protein